VMSIVWWWDFQILADAFSLSSCFQVKIPL
jgi:hypothetical protein